MLHACSCYQFLADFKSPVILIPYIQSYVVLLWADKLCHYKSIPVLLDWLNV